MKIAFLSNLDDNLYLFRMPVMREMKRRGHTVYAVSPGGGRREAFLKEGFIPVEYRMKRESLNPFRELYSIKSIYEAIAPLKLDILQTSTVKPNIYGTIAGRLAKVPHIYNIVEGLGSFYIEDSLKAAAVRFVIEQLYRISSSLSDLTIFVNSEDPQLLVKKAVIAQRKVKVIRSVGIDTKEYDPDRVPPELVAKYRERFSLDERPVVLMVARAIWHKGVAEFYEAASIVGDRAQFVFVGDTDRGNPSCADPDYLNSSRVRWLGRQSDMVELTALADIYVLPSYREGVPRTLLEAASMAKAIVTTDTVGCREVVEDGVNGLLVPVGDAKALAAAIERVLDDDELRERFARASRRKALEEFEVHRVVREYVELYEKGADV